MYIFLLKIGRLRSSEKSSSQSRCRAILFLLTQHLCFVVALGHETQLVVLKQLTSSSHRDGRASMQALDSLQPQMLGSRCL